MTSSQVLLLSNPRAEAENPKPRIVHFWRNVNEVLQGQEENVWFDVLTVVTMQRPLHNGLMTAVEAFAASNKLREMLRYLLSLLRLSLNPSHERPPLALTHQ